MVEFNQDRLKIEALRTCIIRYYVFSILMYGAESLKLTNPMYEAESFRDTDLPTDIC